jgi:antitoxin Phd
VGIKNRINTSYFLCYNGNESRRNNMLIDTEYIVSMTEANQNFSHVARLVDQNGSAIIMKNNKPRYLVIDFSEVETMQMASDADVLNISKDLIRKNKEAYKELAK